MVRNHSRTLLLCVFVFASIAAYFLAYPGECFAGGGGGEEEGEENQVKEGLFALETFLLNLKIPGCYLRTILHLEFEDNIIPKKIEGIQHRVRHSIIKLVSNKSSSEILSKSGKKGLKEEIIETLNDYYRLKVVKVYFSEFVVQ